MQGSSGLIQVKKLLTQGFYYNNLREMARQTDILLENFPPGTTKRYELDYDTLKEIKRLKAILDSPALVDDIIRQELEDVKKKYADKRRTEITREADEITMEDLVADEDVVITITHQGYIKRTSLDEYRSQRRGGKGMKGMATRKEDFIEDLFIASCHDFLLFFTNFGRLYWLKVYQVPELGRAARGKAIVSLIQMSSRERITAVFPVKEFSEGQFLFMATRKGYVKKTSLIAYSKPRASGINAIKIEDNDELIGVRATNGEKDIILSTRDGMSIRFNEKNVREMGRTARGVRGINLKPGDEVVSVGVVEKDSSLLTVTENGFGKRTEVSEYRLQSRGGKGIINIKVTKKNGAVVGLKLVSDSDELMLITQSGMVVRCPIKDIRTTGRAAQGVRIIRLSGKDKVASIAKVVKEEH